MSTTSSPNTSADRGRPLRFLVDRLAKLWRRVRARICNAVGFFSALIALVACSSSTIDSFAAAPCPGSVSISWTITDSQGQPSSCFRSGAASVGLRLQSRIGGAPVFLGFPCRDGTGTANTAPGLYDVTIELHKANGEKIETAPAQPAVAVVPGRTKVLDAVTFHGGQSPPAGGGLSLSLQPLGGFVSNCKPQSEAGAAITGMTITLENVGGGCVPTMFVRKRGGVDIGTYLVNCGSPLVTTCIEQDEALTAPNLAAGVYEMKVDGLIGTSACWRGDNLIQVAPPGQPPIGQTMVLQPINGC